MSDPTWAELPSEREAQVGDTSPVLRYHMVQVQEEASGTHPRGDAQGETETVKRHQRVGLVNSGLKYKRKTNAMVRT